LQGREPDDHAYAAIAARPIYARGLSTGAWTPAPRRAPENARAMGTLAGRCSAQIPAAKLGARARFEISHIAAHPIMELCSREQSGKHFAPAIQAIQPSTSAPVVTQIIGLILVAGCVLGGFVLEGGHIVALWHPTEFVIIVGAALGAFITSNPPKVCKAAFATAFGFVKGPRYKRDDYLALMKLLYEILVKIRKEGLMSIERDLEEPDGGALFKKYPQIVADRYLTDFIRDCLRLMIGGSLDPHELESLLEQELEAHRQEVHEPAEAVQKVADALPGFGIVAAVLGIVNTMAALQGTDTTTIGQKVGAALVGTFLGILVSYGFVGPIAAAMTHQANEETKAFEVVKMALVATVRGYVPAVAIEFSRKLLCSDVRPTFRDLEAELKGKARAAA
jgi:chemotaxis protein MotA